MKPRKKYKIFAEKQEKCIQTQIDNQKKQVEIISQLLELTKFDEHVTESFSVEKNDLERSISELESRGQIFKFAQI